MHSELVALRAQIDRLERTLAVTIFVALVAAIVGTPIAMRAAGGPTKVTAPFTVVDASGRALLQVDARPGGGRLVIYNTAQDRVAEVDASDNGQAGHVRVYLAGEAKPKVSMGVYDDDTGGLDLAGLEGALAQLTGKGIVLANADRHPVASFRQTMDSGWMKLWSDGLPKTELWTDSAGGRLTIFGSNGGEDSGGNSEAATASEALTIEGQTGGLAKMTFLANGKPRNTLGVSADDAGLIRLEGQNGNRVEMHGGNGSFKSYNSAHSEVAVMGIDGGGSGIVDVRHRSAVGGVRLDVSDTGTGNVKVHAPPFEIKAQLGTKGEKGDVCVEGGKGLICLSGVAIKSFIPW